MASEIRVGGIKAKDNTASITIADSTGIVTLSGNLLMPEDGTKGIFGSTYTNTGIRWGGSDVLAFDTGGTERLKIDVNGDVTLTNSLLIPASTEGIFGADDTNTGIRWRGSDALAFDVNGVETMLLETAGLKVLSASSNIQITPGGMIATNAYIDFARAGNPPLLLNRTSSAGQIIKFSLDGGEKGNISVASSSISVNSTSDYRLKENIQLMTGSIDRLNQLKPSRFNFKEYPEIKYDGFLAHEVSDHVPEAISGEKDAVYDDGSIAPQGIDQSKLVPLMVGAIQELSAKVTALENA